MNKVTRKGVFETNSSSTHSITIASLDYLDEDNFPILQWGDEITVQAGYFYNGEWSTFRNKANFLLTCIREEYPLISEGYKYIDMMKNVIEKVTQVCPTILYDSDYYEYSTNALADNKEILEMIFANETLLTSFLFNPTSKIEALQMGSAPHGGQPIE